MVARPISLPPERTSQKLTGRLTPLGVIGVYLVHGFAQLFMTFNVGHDANPSAYSKHKAVNWILGLRVRSLRRQLLHVASEASHRAAVPEADQEGRIGNDHRSFGNKKIVRHPAGELAVLFAGKAFYYTYILVNLHVIHHMFPRICHVHYAPLTRIVKSTAEEFGLTYREARTISGAFLDHLAWLRILGSDVPL